MNPKYEQKYHRIEKFHFWFKARRNFIVQLLRHANREKIILDIGCSSGLLLGDLQSQGFRPENLYGIDISKKAIDNCKKNGLDNCFVMSGEAIKLEQKFDIIIASDCLEHIQNDKKALLNWHKHLTPNGKLYVFVPAFKSLWSHHDEVNMHFRRYTKTDLQSLLKESNFKIETSGYWNITLFIPLYLIRTISKLVIKTNFSTENDNLYHIGWLNQPLLWLLNLENKLLRYMNFPFGISTYAVVKKAGTK